MALEHTNLNVHSFLPLTYGNGPGARACLWLQGCTINCPGCFNQETHSQTGTKQTVNEIVQQLCHSHEIEGLTVSGGEPLQQLIALTALCKEVKAKTGLSIIVFTGYSYAEATDLFEFDLLTKYVDLLIAGPYKMETGPLAGFGNGGHKTFHFFSERYSQSDLDAAPVSEVIIDSNGAVTMTGVDPLRLRRA